MIQQLMTQIEQQLSVHFELFLQEGACAEQIANAEQRIGFAFPQPLKDLYRTRNGEQEEVPGFFLGLNFLPLEQLVRAWENMSRLADDSSLDDIVAYSVPPHAIKERYMNRGWLPIAADGGGNYLGVDLDPDSAGTYGQVINFGRDEEVKCVIAHSITDFLAFMVETLNNGFYTFYIIDDEECWNYGEKEGVHPIDAIKSAALPVSQS